MYISVTRKPQLLHDSIVAQPVLLQSSLFLLLWGHDVFPAVRWQQEVFSAGGAAGFTVPENAERKTIIATNRTESNFIAQMYNLSCKYNKD
ncbi:MAG: hypothetical protein ACXVJD_03615 [Mucilaginibacter sp.]